MVTRNEGLNFYGGTTVKFSPRSVRLVNTAGLLLLMLLVMSTSAFAQGSIFGTVSNTDASIPANGEISFVGYLDNTDEEIRIETSDGAGYDAGNWFDDFQNYLTEAPGNPYDYHFYNSANGEGFQLSAAIPNNSFQQENVTLAPVSWPAAPADLTGVTLSGTSVLLQWTGAGGLTYHVYRRMASSNGSLFRIDDPSGSLAGGVSTTYYVDNGVSGGGSYSYLIIARDASGNLSPHSAVITVNTAALDAPVLTSIDPTTGTATGGTLITIYGSGFDPAGAQVLFGTSPVVATVVSPFEMTATTPAGTVGAVLDITVTNAASGLSSNTLVGGFTYAANADPVLAAIGNRSVTEGEPLRFSVSATDVDGATPLLSTTTLPTGASFVDNGGGNGTFSWNPTYTDAGAYPVTFYATDGVVPTAIDSEAVVITVIEAGNQPPVITSTIGDQSVAENGTLSLSIEASDPDGTTPTLSAALTGTGALADNMAFTDNTDGTGSFAFNPDFTQAGVYSVAFRAEDGLAVDSLVVQITVTEFNQPPVLAAIGPQSTAEDVPLTFIVTANDPDGTTPVLTTSTLPGTAVFTDNGDGTGSFGWTPGFADAGDHNVTFYATDATFPADIDSELVVITVTDAGNQAPVITSAFVPLTLAEGDSLFVLLEATDADGTTPQLSALMENGDPLVANMIFADSANGRGVLEFRPGFTQAGAYSVAFIASDGALADTALLNVTVTDAGNLPPVFAAVGDFSVNEGNQLVINVSATDPDGAIAPTLSVSTTLNHYTFVNNGDGTGILTYDPTFMDAGTDTVSFVALDFGTPQRTATAISVVTTVDINQAPTLSAPGPFSVKAGKLLQFTVTAVDSTDPIPGHRVLLSTIGLPTNATFADNGDNTGTFSFTPTESQAGIIPMTFLAVDQGTPQLSATLPVNITVVVQNHPPVFGAIAPQIVTEGETLTISVSATDVDGTIPSLDTTKAPAGSAFTDNGDGTGLFTFTPDYYGHTRLTSVTFKAYDGIDVVRSLVLIQVNDAGNQSPEFDSIPAPSLTEGETLTQVVSATDPDRDPLILAVDESVMDLPANAAFVDNGDGTGTFTFEPDFTQSGFYDVYIAAFDGPVDGETTLSDTIIMTVGVIEFGNHDPVLTEIPDQTTGETLTLTFSVTATDIDGDSLVLYTGVLPANASFQDMNYGNGAFTFNPDYTQQGTHEVWFYATDLTATDSQMVTITVIDMNRPPAVFPPVGNTIYEGDTAIYIVEGTDPDGSFPLLGATLSGTDTLATHMTFVDTQDGFGTLTFIPGPTQGGPSSNPTRYYVAFSATDADYPDVTEYASNVTIRVIDRNFAPVLSFPFGGEGPFTLDEGASIEVIAILTDPDMVADFPSMTIENPPDSNYTFNYNAVLGRGVFTFSPDFTQDGVYNVRFIGIDERNAADTAVVSITVNDAGNQAPTFIGTSTDTLRVPINYIYDIVVEASDPELDSITLVAEPMLTGASWTDNGDGTWIYSFIMDSSSLGSVYEVTFIATDYPAQACDTLVVYSIGVSFLRGDMDQDNIYTVNDLALMIDFLFREGQPPAIEEISDVDKDGRTSISDLSYLIFYMYKNGPPPLP